MGNARLANRVRKATLDYRLFFIIISLVISGIIFLSSASSVISFQEFNDSGYMFKKQAINILIGFAFMGIFYHISIDFWKKISFPAIIVSAVMMIMVFLPFIGVEHAGARRWIDLGFAQIQPSEILKFSLILYLAHLFEKKGQLVKDIYHGFIPFISISVFIALLVMKQPDLGTFLVLVMIASVIYFVSGAKMSHIASVVALGIAGIFALIKISPYRLERFMVFLNPESHSQLGAAYQTKQSLIAVGSGGILGLGFGESLQKYKYLPEAATDSIFAIVAEERGFIGAVLIVFLFTVFGILGFRLAQKTSDSFSRLVVVGITSWIVFQATLNIATALSLVPLTGVTLPFISFGGTSVAIVIAACGLLLRISKDSMERSRNENNSGRRRHRRARHSVTGSS